MNNVTIANKAKFGTEGNHSEFEDDGTMKFSGDATVWEDLRFPATQLRVNPVTNVPDFDYANLGFLFPQNDDSEIIYAIAQMPHAWKQGSAIKPHIHFIQESASEPVFKIEYRMEPDASFTPSTSNGFAVSYPGGSAVIHQIATFPEIDMSGYPISSVIDFKIYRDDNVVTGDVLFKEFDIHYQIDTVGSRSEYTK